MAGKLIKTTFVPRDTFFTQAIHSINRIGITDFDKPKFTVGDTGISSRVISHWTKNGLLPNGVKGKKGWHKFTSTEMVWLKVVTRLRNFGFPIRKIAKIKEQVMIFDRKSKIYPIFKYYLSMAFIRDADIIVLANGMADMAMPIEMMHLKDRLPLEQRDMLFVSLKSIAEEMGFKTAPAKTLMPVSPREAVLVFESQSKKNKEVKAILKNGEIKELESTAVFDSNPDMLEINQDIKGRQEYAEVTTKYEKGVKQSAVVKKKLRF